MSEIITHSPAELRTLDALKIMYELRTIRNLTSILQNNRVASHLKAPLVAKGIIEGVEGQPHYYIWKSPVPPNIRMAIALRKLATELRRKPSCTSKTKDIKVVLEKVRTAQKSVEPIKVKTTVLNTPKKKTFSLLWGLITINWEYYD